MELSDQTSTAKLLRPMMTQARLLLRRYGSFGPVGYVMDGQGSVHRVSVEIKRLPPDPAELRGKLLEHIAEQAASGQLLGAGIAQPSVLEQPSSEGFCDAVIGHVEMKDGHVLEATLPYRVSGGQMGGIIPRKVVFGEVRVNNTASNLFFPFSSSHAHQT